MKNYLIIISGPPGTGKTTFGEFLSEKLQIPFFNKDCIKEILFDDLGYRDRKLSKTYGVASYNILYLITEKILKADLSLILDSNFKTEFDTPKFKILKEKYDFRLIQVVFGCDGKTLFERFKKRSESDERHPGHVDHANYAEFEDLLLKGEQGPLDLVGEIIRIDTTDFAKVNYEKQVEQISKILIDD